MMIKSTAPRSTGFDQWYLAAIAITLAITVFLIAWLSISRSRSDSFALLVEQGKAFTESLAVASKNAIAAESIYYRLIQDRYGALVTSLLIGDVETPSEQQMARFALSHDLLGIYIYDSQSRLVISVAPRGRTASLPDYVQREVSLLLEEPESNFLLLSDDDETLGEMVHYYLELTSQMDRVVVLAVDAGYYSDALHQTGIGYLAQNMAREKGVEYIIYQDTEGIIFASRKPGDLLAIESDPFLSAALESDSIMSRVYKFQERQVLELVRPFSTDVYPLGLFRVGLALDRYYAVSRGFDKQTIILSGVLVVLLMVALLYLAGRRKRQELSRRYSDIKSVTDRIFEQMISGVVVVDSGGVIRIINQAAQRMFSTPNVSGQSWDKILPLYQPLFDEFVAGDKSADEIEFKIEIDNQTKILLIARSKLYDVAEHQAAVVMVLYDITRLKEYEREAARKERLSEMGHLAAGVAHEIRNPLNAISIAAQRIAAEFKPDENSEEFISFTDQIRSETSRLNAIITRFLALAREDRKRRQVIMLDESLGEIGRLLKVEGDRIGIEVSIHAEPNLSVEVDPDGLKELFLNLYSNSREALAGAPGRFSVNAVSENERIKITIEDSGPGIPAAVSDKLFAPYYTTKDGGTGLGLPTAQRIVSEFGGDIHLDKQFVGGARFVVSIPRLKKS